MQNYVAVFGTELPFPIVGTQLPFHIWDSTALSLPIHLPTFSYTYTDAVDLVTTLLQRSLTPDTVNASATSHRCWRKLGKQTVA